MAWEETAHAFPRPTCMNIRYRTVRATPADVRATFSELTGDRERRTRPGRWTGIGAAASHMRGALPKAPGLIDESPASARIQRGPAGPLAAVGGAGLIRPAQIRLASRCAALRRARHEQRGQRQVRRGVVGLSSAIADQLGRLPLRHPAIVMDGEGVPVPALWQSNSHTMSLKPAWPPDDAPARPRADQAASTAQSCRCEYGLSAVPGFCRGIQVLEPLAYSSSVNAAAFVPAL